MLRISVFTLLLMLLTSAIRTTLSASGSSGKKSFYVGVWLGMYSDYWPSEKTEWLRKVDEAFKSFREAGIDAIYFLVKDPWGYVYYESKYAPLSEKYSWDLLREVVAKAREHGLQVYPYVNALAEGETQPNFYLKEHPDLAVSSANGENGWVDPSSGEYVNRLISIVEEIVSNYDVDGLQLDRIRMPGPVIRAKASEKLYTETTGLTPANDEKKWQEFVRVFEKVKSIDMSLRLSAAVFPSPSNAALNQLQDWKKWVEEGWVDYVCTMAYAQGFYTFKAYVDEEKEACEPGKLYVGIGAWQLSASELKKQIKYVVVDSGLPGVLLFNGDSLLSNTELLNAVKEAKEGKFGEDSSSFPFMLSASSATILLCTTLFLLHLHGKKRRKNVSLKKAY
ncbi:MAG: family 10 glycosylhydrolase [Thaumarchaeota archaeon]|nr:family 10 glycosylhydrolase [Nitrososphaerota archaeon]